MGSTPIFPATIVNSTTQILPATASGLVTIATGGTNGTKIESILVSSTDTTARDVSLYFTVSGTDYLIGTVNIPITAGAVNSVPNVNIFKNYQIQGFASDSNGNQYLYLASGTTLRMNCLTTVTAAKAINIVVQGGNF